MKALVLIFHPNAFVSRANRPLTAKTEILGSDVTMRYIYNLYPDQKVNIAAEQAAPETAGRIVLQFSVCWYSTPTLFEQRLDGVLLYGQAYGSTGKALAGEEPLMAVNIGGPGDAYSRESSYGYTFTRLLRPLQATANMVQMTYPVPLTTTGILTTTDGALTQRTEDYAATLQSMDLPALDLRG